MLNTKFLLLATALVLVFLAFTKLTKSTRNSYTINVWPLDELTSLNEDTSEPNYVFIDLGANKGDSLENFFGLAVSGGGGNLQQLLPPELVQHIQTKKWIVHGYEANPTFNQGLNEIKAKLEARSHTIFLNTQTAAWLYDGTIDFYLDTVNEAFSFWGSSLKKNAIDVIKSNQVKITVACHDIGRIIKLYRPKDIVVVKMDIEGAEYDLIIDLFRKDALKLIDYLAIEYHPLLIEHKVHQFFFKDLLAIDQVKIVNWV